MEHRTSNYYLGIILLFTSVCGQDFGYSGDLGPSHWGEQYTSCLGKYQSPININSLNVKRTHLPPLLLQGFKSSPGHITLTNNGHTLMLSVDSENPPTISGGPLADPYVFTQLHFHWGENDDEGSEDLLDGRSFPMELHMVFYKKPYRNVRSAMDHHDGLTVLAFFYEITDKKNPKYEALLSHIKEVAQPKSNISIDDTTSFADLVPSQLSSYYTYKGSLTTPPCSEVVTWIDFKEPIPLSHDQLQTFRSLYDSHGHLLTHNFRPIQPVGDRTVWYVSKEAESELKLNSSSPRPPSVNESSTTDAIDADERKIIEQDDNSLDDGASDISTKKSSKHFKNLFKNRADCMEVSKFLIVAVCGLYAVVYLSKKS